MNTLPIKNRERILEAIDQLRRRKARPDIQRICNYLFRRFSISSQEAKNDLQRCVDTDVVLKVEYKGSISYRNAAKKYSHVKREQPVGDAVDGKANRKFAQLLTNAFGELVVLEPDYLEVGVPGEEIVANILSKDSVRYTRKYVNILIDKEVDNGGLVRLENERYLMGPTKGEAPVSISEVRAPKDIDIKDLSQAVNVKLKKKPGPKPGFKRDRSTENMDSDEKKSENGVMRVGGRRKRARKVVFDPSDTHIPRRRGRPIGSLNKSTIEKQLAKINDESRPDSRTSNNGREQGGVCSVCHAQNKRGPNDRMVSCRECSNKAHYSCLNGEDMMLRTYPDNTWQCPHCKTCVVCYETSDAGSLTVCAVCADAYHSGCHQPRIPERVKSTTKWLCINCEMPEELKINEIESNLSNSFSSKLTNGNDTNDNSSSSISGNTTPNYQSPPLSPTPPHLSPQNEIQQNCDSDSQSNKDDEDDKDDKDEKDFKIFAEKKIDPAIPDATNWTIDDVYQYFVQFFPEEAKIFKEQEIDGRSLLLLRRIDVLTNLKLKLGPALKIYKHVVKLQVRRDDPKLYWL